MSLFGNTQTASPFGAAANKPSAFPALGSSTTTGTSTGGLFGGAPQNQQGTAAPSLFGTPATTQTNSLFSSTAQKPATSAFGSTTQQQQPSMFGSTTAQKPATSMFGATAPQQQTQQPAAGSGLFGGGSAFGASTLQAPQQQQQQQQQQPQQSQFGQTTMVQPQGQPQEQSLSSSLWSPGRAITGVHRTVPMQIAIVRDKWDAQIRSSPFRAYLYNHVGDDNAPFFQPGFEDDETKWEEALRKRPGSGYVPVLVKGFMDLGKRAQRQKDFLAMLQTRLHEINNCLTDLLSRHDLKISVKVADARRKHIVLSKRCLALAAKTQMLRNRGYAMDDAEEELKKKLTQLERSVFDPSLNGRGEEIWARMLAIHEHSKRLQVEMDRAGANVTTNGEDEIDEQTMKTAKKILDDYHAQIQHLQKEMEVVKKDFEEAQKLGGK
ncbi:Nucleoporin NUP57 [Penicillium subrubescens]|uniref:Nucleoporin NUP57 n=1 Tax=Penicillium subrubescens TaxID=1316194 RepID=A0A1Q5SZK4_9EURO|nr:Nucleoporin NUP57 [Penicillium subrubescens]KAJ5883672.1 Nucleoporin NUP57 [Penicillium subrubescens]OKO93424.1 Nucleoporin NUP57 [Penicillium subrubescens]